jgi:hypothetical protein
LSDGTRRSFTSTTETRLPQLGTCLLHLAKPRWSFRLNAAFEVHAEHEYMRYVAAHSETEQQPFNSELADRWTVPVTVADVLRQIGHDERMHKEDSQRSADPDQPALADEPIRTSQRAA